MKIVSNIHRQNKHFFTYIHRYQNAIENESWFISNRWIDFTYRSSESFTMRNRSIITSDQLCNKHIGVFQRIASNICLYLPSPSQMFFVFKKYFVSFVCFILDFIIRFILAIKNSHSVSVRRDDGSVVFVITCVFFLYFVVVVVNSENRLRSLCSREQHFFFSWNCHCLLLCLFWFFEKNKWNSPKNHAVFHINTHRTFDCSLNAYWMFTNIEYNILSNCGYKLFCERTKYGHARSMMMLIMRKFDSTPNYIVLNSVHSRVYCMYFIVPVHLWMYSSYSISMIVIAIMILVDESILTSTCDTLNNSQCKRYCFNSMNPKFSNTQNGTTKVVVFSQNTFVTQNCYCRHHFLSNMESISHQRIEHDTMEKKVQRKT